MPKRAKRPTTDRKPSHKEVFKSDQILRKKMNKFNQHTDDHRADLANNPEELAQKVQFLDNLLGEVKSTDAATRNTKALTTLTSINKESVEKMKRAGVDKFRVEDLLRNIARRFEGEEHAVDFVALGLAFRKYLRQAPGLTFLNGPISTEYVRKERKAGQKRSRSRIDENSQAVKPQVGLDKEEEKTNSAARAQTLASFLPLEEKPVGYFQYVVNPHSFTETVENMFDTAFLIKEGHCCIQLDEQKGYPIIYKMNKPGVAEYGVSVFPAEMVMKFNHDDFERVVKAFDITESMLPTRYKEEEEKQQPGTTGTRKQGRKKKKK